MIRGTDVNSPWRFVVFVAGCAIFPGFTGAQEISVRAPEASDEVKTVLRAASLIQALKQEEGNPTAEDLIAAAQADYRRLLTALYTQGFYGGQISILVDGREASTISPLATPTSIGEIIIDVDTGPQFTFGTASVAPIPAGTVLPEEFRTGQPAASTAIEDAARTGVSAWRDAGHAMAQIAINDKQPQGFVVSKVLRF